MRGDFMKFGKMRLVVALLALASEGPALLLYHEKLNAAADSEE